MRFNLYVPLRIGDAAAAYLSAPFQKLRGGGRETLLEACWLTFEDSCWRLLTFC
jgi:hypothetical protein